MTDSGQPPPAVLEKIPFLEAKHWRALTDYSASFMEVGLPTQTSYLFRGQSDADVSLLPSFARHAVRGRLEVKDALYLEKHALTEFTRQAHLHLDSGILGDTHGLMGWWSLMQHYGAPTRLLDWTRSFFVAAYFAVAGHFDKPGAIWVVRVLPVREYMKRRYGSAYLPAGRDATEQRQEIELLQTFKSDPGLYFVRRPRETDRMAAQQGFFSVAPYVLADHAEVLYRLVVELTPNAQDFLRVVIPAEGKLELSKQLLAMNVTARALFPGVDGLGKTVEELVRTTSLSMKGKAP